MVDTITTRPNAISVSVTDLVRARVSSNPVTIPVNGTVFARLRNVTALPSGTESGGISYMKIRALDSMIGRLRQERPEAHKTETDALERRLRLIEETARLIAEESEPESGLFFDMLA